MSRVVLKAEGGLVLKQFVLEDAQVIFDLIDRNRDHLSQFGDRTAEKYPNCASVDHSIRRPSNSAKLRLGIWDKDVYVGTINFTPSSDGKSGEVGYYLGKEFEGHKYISRALKRLIDYVFREGYEELCAYVFSNNEKSIHLLRNNGFVFDKNKSKGRLLYLFLRKNGGTSGT